MRKILPMLAHAYDARGDAIEFPCLVQPKLDGVRALWYNGSLYSRNGNEFAHLDHIKAALRALRAGTRVFDGELYSDEIDFQTLVGFIKRSTIKPDDREEMKKIRYVIYDYVSSADYADRLATLEAQFRGVRAPLELIATEVCARREDVPSFLRRYERAGYEGVMVRNLRGAYAQGARSPDLQKLKSTRDAEFRVVGYDEGTGRDAGLVIWVCATREGREFRVRPAGTREERAALFREAARHVGSWLTVRFQELTLAGVPRFPVGVALRDYE